MLGWIVVALVQRQYFSFTVNRLYCGRDKMTWPRFALYIVNNNPI